MYDFLFHFEYYDLIVSFKVDDLEDAYFLADEYARKSECFNYEYIGEDEENVQD